MNRRSLVQNVSDLIMEDFDVTIIGAGLAGLQCARLLGRQGLRVLLVDRKASLDQKIHTTGIFVRRTLEDFDIPEDCLGPVVRHVSLYSPQHRLLQLESKHDEFRVGRMGRLYSRYLTQCLLAGVEWLPQASYIDSSHSGRTSTVRLNVRFLGAECNYEVHHWCRWDILSRRKRFAARHQSRMDRGSRKCLRPLSAR